MNLFGFGAENAKSTNRPFPVSEVVDNVELDNVEYVNAISASGISYEGVKFYFKKNLNGQTSYLTELKSPPRKEWAQERMLPDGTKITKEEDYISKMKEYVSYLRHIAFGFGVTDEELTSKGQFSTFEEAAKSYCQVLSLKKNNSRAYLKTVKNKDGYTALPSYIGAGFCASMDGERPAFKYTDREIELIELASRTGIVEETSSSSNTQTTTQSKSLSSSDIDNLI